MKRISTVCWDTKGLHKIDSVPSPVGKKFWIAPNAENILCVMLRGTCVAIKTGKTGQKHFVFELIDPGLPKMHLGAGTFVLIC